MRYRYPGAVTKTFKLSKDRIGLKTFVSHLLSTVIIVDKIILVATGIGLERELVQLVADACRAARLTTRSGYRIRSDLHADLMVRADRHAYVVELKAFPEARRSHLSGMLASAILQARALAKQSGLEPLAVVGAPHISNTMFRELEEFATAYGEGTSWGVADSRGFVELRGPGLEHVRGIPEQKEESLTRGSFDPFSDRGQWMLKILLSPRLPPQFRVADADRTPVADVPSTAVGLAALSRVSVPVASRFVEHLRREHFCRPRGPIEIVRTQELLSNWQIATARTPIELPTRWLIPTQAPDKLDETLRGLGISAPQYCLGLFAASARHGMSFAQGIAPHLYVRTIDKTVLDRLGLRPAESWEQTDVFVRQPRFPESVFRGATYADGCWVSDVFQTWLDLQTHPARGREVANEIFSRILGPSLLVRG